jgi:serine phosphatase RsbU (regulator of sigma subunit)
MPFVVLDRNLGYVERDLFDVLAGSELIDSTNNLEIQKLKKDLTEKATLRRSLFSRLNSSARITREEFEQLRTLFKPVEILNSLQKEISKSTILSPFLTLEEKSLVRNAIQEVLKERMRLYNLVLLLRGMDKSPNSFAADAVKELKEGLIRFYPGKKMPSHCSQALGAIQAGQSLTHKDWESLIEAVDFYNFPLSKIQAVREEVWRNQGKDFVFKDANLEGSFVQNPTQGLFMRDEEELPKPYVRYGKKAVLLSDLGVDALTLERRKFLPHEDIMQFFGTRWRKLNVIGQDVSCHFSTRPVGHSLEDYHRGFDTPPSAVITVFLKEMLLANLFEELFSRDLSAIERDNIDSYVERNFPGVLPPIKSLYRELFEIKYHSKQQVQEASQMFTSSQTWLEEFKNYFWFLPRNTEYNTAKMSHWQLSSTSRMLPRTAGLKILVEEGVVKASSTTLAEIKQWAIGDTSEPFLFSYTHDSQEYLGSLIGSRVMYNHVFFISLDRSLVFAYSRILLVILPLILSLTLILTLFLSRRLVTRVVKPIQELTIDVQRFSDGSLLDYRRAITRDDEIGQMFFFFKSMVQNINAKVREESFINRLNDLVVQGHPIEAQVQFSIHKLAESCEADFGYIGFYENTSKEKLIVSASHCSVYRPAQELAELKSELRKRILTSSGQDFLAFDPSEARGLGFQNLIVHSIKTLPLDLSESLKKEEEFQFPSQIPGTDIEGFFILGNFPEEALDDEKREFLRSFCSQMVTVVSKSHLDEMNMDNIEGQAIQVGLMPTQVPKGKGPLEIAFSFEAAKYLGGDFFDFIPFDDLPKLGLAIADVSGKGIGPSLFGITCKSMLQILAQKSKETNVTMIELNDILYREKPHQELFSTMFYCIYDWDRMTLTYTSAGHNNMLLLRHDAVKVEYLGAKDPPLAMISPFSYQKREISMSIGDWLLLYTDGITELRNPLGSFFELKGLEEFLVRNRRKGITEFKSDLMLELDHFRKGRLPEDDITFIAIKVGSERHPLEPLKSVFT